MDFEDEEMGMGPTGSYDSLGNPGGRVKVTSSGGEIMMVHTNNNKAKYRECLKNHAVSIGGHALDGCGEFLPAGPDGTIDALKCAACNCHRNFHRKESDPTEMEPYLLTHHHHQQPPPPRHHHHQFSAYYRPAGYLHVGGQGRCGAHNNIGEDHHHEEEEEEDVSGGDGGNGNGNNNNNGDGGVMRNKRFRTKFTQEQKEKMLGLAERLGWRIQKHDEAVVQQFCDDTGVRRHVLKVWMHNNKHTLGKKP